MAQQVSVTLVDDLDGSEAAETVSFGLDGRAYEIDLSVDNAARLRDAIAPFVAAAAQSWQWRFGWYPPRTASAGGPGRASASEVDS